MYRILIADDEGIMVESLKTIISRQFSDCEIETAKTGRTAIEQAELFKPDIVLMDIQMPGLNGIEAMKEIRTFNSTALFYVLSAYDKFEYAKEAISMGVERYLMKPVTKSTVIEIITEAIGKVDQLRRKRMEQIQTQEKLETIIPVVENGFVSAMLLQDDWQEAGYYKQLLDIPEDYAYVMLFKFGTNMGDGRIGSSVGLSVKVQGLMAEFRAVVKSFLRCIIGQLSADKVVVVIPCAGSVIDYDERVRIIETAESIADRLEMRLHVNFRAGIGRVRELSLLKASYLEATQALREGDERVVHAGDIISRGEYEGDFPADTEKAMFRMLGRGDEEEMKQQANQFFDWMVRRYPGSRDNIRLKVLEFVLAAEKDAFQEGAVNYGFEFRENYLTEVMAIEDYELLRDWFLDKMTKACESIRNRRNNQSETVVSKARTFIQENYCKDISLDDVSREVNVSPYYFSKLFKEEAGENFIEYLTRLRMEKARQMLAQTTASIKEISMSVGYTDPNYFSRIFKKQTEMTPREYREANS